MAYVIVLAFIEITVRTVCKFSWREMTVSNCHNLIIQVIEKVWINYFIFGVVTETKLKFSILVYYL